MNEEITSANDILVKSYVPKDKHALMGVTFLQAAGNGTLTILEEVLGIPKQAHASMNLQVLQSTGFKELATLTTGTGVALTSEALKTLMKTNPYTGALAVGLALDTMLNNGELTKALAEMVKSSVGEVVQSANNAMDVIKWVTADQGFSGAPSS